MSSIVIILFQKHCWYIVVSLLKYCYPLPRGPPAYLRLAWPARLLRCCSHAASTCTTASAEIPQPSRRRPDCDPLCSLSEMTAAQRPLLSSRSRGAAVASASRAFPRATISPSPFPLPPLPLPPLSLRLPAGDVPHPASADTAAGNGGGGGGWSGPGRAEPGQATGRPRRARGPRRSSMNTLVCKQNWCQNG